MTKELDTEQNKINPKINVWSLDLECNLTNISGKIKFLILMIIIGLIFVFFGDIFYHITFQITGLFCIILGCCISFLGFSIPLIHFIVKQL